MSSATNRLLIISLTHGKDAAIARAQRRANLVGRAFGVWEHVGIYGRPEGDIASTHEFRVIDFSDPDPPATFALVACVDPEGV